MKLLTFLSVLAICFSSTALAIELNRSNQSGIAEAYGFVVGQQMTLDRIANRYPDLAREAFLAGLSFERTFGDVRARVEPIFKQALGQEMFEKFQSDLKRELQGQSRRVELTRTTAEAFLEEVHSRSEGNIYSPALEFLLAIRFEKYPVDEFIEGFRKRYRTDGIGKSLGVVLNMQLPQSWKGMEGNRPHIVRKWKSEAGTGNELIMLQVRETGVMNVSRADVAELMQPDEVMSLLPDGSELEEYGLVSVENMPGYFVDFSHLNERAGMAIYQKIRQYSIYYRDKLILVQCSAGALERDYEAVESSFESVKPVCTQVFNSLVLPEEYKNSEPELQHEDGGYMPSI